MIRLDSRKSDFRIRSAVRLALCLSCSRFVWSPQQFGHQLFPGGDGNCVAKYVAINCYKWAKTNKKNSYSKLCIPCMRGAAEILSQCVRFCNTRMRRSVRAETLCLFCQLLFFFKRFLKCCLYGQSGKTIRGFCPTVHSHAVADCLRASAHFSRVDSAKRAGLEPNPEALLE